MPYKDSVERFDDFQCRNYQFYEVIELASLEAKNWQILTIFGAENRARMTVLGSNLMEGPNWIL